MKRLSIVTAVLVVVLATASAAAAKTVIYSGAGGGSFASKPAKLKYSEDESDTSQSFKLKDLSWKNWGSGKGTSAAKLKACSDSAGCFTTTDASVKAKKLVTLDTIGYYTKLVVSFGQNAVKISLPTP